MKPTTVDCYTYCGICGIKSPIITARFSADDNEIALAFKQLGWGIKKGRCPIHYEDGTDSYKAQPQETDG